MTAIVPSALTEGLASDECEAVVRWWRQLSEQVQTQVADLWDARWDNTALASQGEAGETQWHVLPIQLMGRLVDEETRREDRMIKQQLFEYIVNHEDIVFFLEERRYHICRAHSAARAVIRNGFIPASFQCPLGNGTGCPMQQLLAAARGKSVQFSPQIGSSRVET